MSKRSGLEKLFERAWKKAILSRPGHPANLTEQEEELLLACTRLHNEHCNEPNTPEGPTPCWMKGGYLGGKPWYGNDLEKARKVGLLV
jgi:hypothetical protein